jgi:hypothetical protein
MLQLKHDFPETKFIFCTVPLVSESGRLKTLLKLLMGKGNTNRTENIQRNKFNQLLLKQFASSEIVLDIARFESNNYQTFFMNNNTKIYTLYPGYTTDGGHLNDEGSKVVGNSLLELLANMN